ncbi:hypothetical protein [Schaalia suimastitidis]|uniref:hypothetical protein n=1 Tax=Schaalia suimastitidis TaxID=121163 RepID=UPI0004008A37|nr:hypothetical protein [Schaalia suimastitidis]
MDPRLAHARKILRKTEETLGISSASTQGHLILEVPNNAEIILHAAHNFWHEEQWAAFVETPNIGWNAAHNIGLDLDHILIIPQTYGQGARILTHLIGAVGLLCVGASIPIKSHTRLAAQARKSNTIILTLHPWIGISRPWRDHSIHIHKAV